MGGAHRYLQKQQRPKYRLKLPYMVILLQVSTSLHVLYGLNPHLHPYGVLGTRNPQVQVNLPAGFFTGFLQVPSVHLNLCYPLMQSLSVFNIVRIDHNDSRCARLKDYITARSYAVDIHPVDHRDINQHDRSIHLCHTQSSNQLFPEVHSLTLPSPSQTSAALFQRR